MPTQHQIDTLGAAYTPDHITNKMLDFLAAPAWWSSATFCDPACGDGNMLTVFLRRKLAVGHNPIMALSTIYGADVQPGEIIKARQRLREMVYAALDPSEHLHNMATIEAILEHNIFVVEDSLTFDWTKLQPLNLSLEK